MKTNKVLIISHNPIGDEDNVGRTLKNVFENFSCDELCQIYIRNQKPRFDICNNLFYINENQLIKSKFFNHKYSGKIVHEEDCLDIGNTLIHKNSYKDVLYNILKRKNQINYFVRDFVWSKEIWFESKLKKWLLEQKPTCIFFVISDYCFMIDIVFIISKFLNIPVFTYTLDDYYYGKNNQIIPIEHFIYKKKLSNLMKFTKVNFCLSEKMVVLYNCLFECRNELLMNSVTISENENIEITNTIKMFYMGNLDFGRWENLVNIERIISRYNNTQDNKIVFEVYSPETNKSIIKKLTKHNKTFFKGRISYEDVTRKIEEADILIHVESFKKNQIKKVQYSLSTKIPDLLNSGKIILAYGPLEDEAINYLFRNKAAIVAKNQFELNQFINNLYQIKNYNELRLKSFDLLKKNHSSKKNYEKIMILLEEFCENCSS